MLGRVPVERAISVAHTRGDVGASGAQSIYVLRTE
jgi:hypothetical protein